ncbi:MAG: zinc-binding dehydrogenase, partial [Rhodospirillales bacterium]
AAAKAAGGHVTVDGRGDDLAPRLKAAIGGPARTIVDLVNDATSAPAAFAALGRGGRLIMVGMFGGAMSLPLMMMPLQGLTLRGSYVGSPAELRALLDLATSGRLAPIPVTRVPRDDVMAAMIRLDEGRVDGRLVLETAF